MEQLYYNHYITTDEKNCITDGWSDGPLPEKSSEGAILLDNKGGYQFRLCPDGEENPALYEWDHVVPLYVYENGAVRARTQAEIDADIAAVPIPESEPSLDQRVAEVELGVTGLNAVVSALLTGEGML